MYLRRRGVLVLLWGDTQTQQNPWKSVHPTTIHQKCMEGSLHSAMKMLTQTDSLRVVSSEVSGEVQLQNSQQLHSTALNHCSEVLVIANDSGLWSTKAVNLQAS